MKNSELIELKNELYAIPNLTPYIKSEIEKVIDKHLLEDNQPKFSGRGKSIDIPDYFIKG